jgi:type IV pilus assembly protein PilN
MAGINLLPWRAERRKQKQQEFFSITALALLSTAAVLLLVHFQIGGSIDYQNQRNEYLKSEVALLDQKIKEIENLETKKKRLIAKMEVIQQLQLSRPEIVHLFDELARTIPEGVQLTDVTQTDRLLVMNGIAQSNARISVYMRNLESSQWLQDPVLNVIEAKAESKDKKDQRGNKFTLQVRQASENKQGQGKSPS